MAAEPQWDTLRHAYGSAGDIPTLLGRAEFDLRRGHETGSTWFQLWSALCHQGDAYSASYAAVPALIRLAETPIYSAHYDPLLLAACIELARLEGTGPQLPDESIPTYLAALKRGRVLATEALKNSAMDSVSVRAYRGCVAAFHGQSIAARNILDEDDNDAV